jgi:uroporphyrinogen decarboxylase
MKAELTSRQRVNLALNHQEPDRVPFDMTLTVDVYYRLRQHLGLPAESGKPVGIWSDVSPSLDLLDAMQVDILYLGLNPASHSSPLKQEDGLHYDQWGVGRRKVVREDGSYYFEMVKHPLANPSWEALENYPWPDPYDPARSAGVREKFLHIRSATDKAIASKFTTSIWEQATYLVGLQTWLELMVYDPDLAGAILDMTCQVALGLADVGLSEAGDLIDIFRLSGEDLGTQTNALISPRMYDRIVRPRHARLWSYVKERLAEINPGVKLMLHSCGNVRPFISRWIEMGLDILDPIQPNAAGMDPAGLKADFGDRLTFHGGLDLQEILPFGSLDDVRRHVADYLHTLAPGGGYILAPAHNVQSDVPVENLVAIRDANLELGKYPIR